MPYIPTLQILNAVQSLISGMTMVVGGNSQAVFELVKLYDATEVDRAFADLRIARQKRLCFIIPGKQAYRHENDGAGVTSYKTASFALLICNTDKETGLTALFGSDTGVIALADYVVDHLTGADLGLAGVQLLPEDGDDFTVFDNQNPSDPGRKGWLQVFSTDAGTKGVRRSIPARNGIT